MVLAPVHTISSTGSSLCISNTAAVVIHEYIQPVSQIVSSVVDISELSQNLFKAVTHSILHLAISNHILLVLSNHSSVIETSFISEVVVLYQAITLIIDSFNSISFIIELSAVSVAIIF